MGVIFERRPSPDVHAAAVEASMMGSLHDALLEEPPQDALVANQRAKELAQPVAKTAVALASQQGSVGIKFVPFLVTLALFFALLGITIFLDWKNVVDDPKVYSGMVTTAL